MDNLKKIIIALMLVIIVIIAILIIMLNKANTKKNDNEQVVDSQGDVGEEVEITGKEEYVTEYETIKIVENCIQRYYDSLDKSSLSEEGEQGTKVEIAQNQEILSYLSKEYISKNNLSETNINQHITKLENRVLIVALNMKVIVNETTDKYAVYGKLIDSEYKDLGEFCIYVNLDIHNKTFSIEPIDEVKELDKITIENSNNISIQKNEYNEYTEEAMGDDKVCREFVIRYKKLALSNVRIAYNYLNEEYRSKRFGNIENYVQYIKDNYNSILQANVKQYKVDYNDEYTEFVCIDQYNNYYIVRAKSLLDFNIILDTYTIDLPDILERYNKASNQQKATINAGKVMNAINAKDYRYVYEKLDDTFKNNNYKDYNSFRDYLKNNLFEVNKFESSQVKQEGDVFVILLQVTDAIGNLQGTKEMTIIVQLKQGTDFAMSFSIK